MAPKIRITARQVKKSTPKKKNKTKTPRKVAFKVPQEIQDKCRDWAVEQKRIHKTEYDYMVAEELPSDDEDKHDIDDGAENPAEFEIPFRELVKTNGSKESVKMMLECEWNRCDCEFTDVKSYHAHINEHVSEITDEMETEELFVCQWSLCQFTTPDIMNLRRHLIYHAYHTRIKTNGANLCYTVKLPVCKISSENRNVIPERNSDYFCYWDDCQESFVSIQNFFDHVAYHVMLEYPNIPSNSAKTLKEIPCKWENCDKKFKQKIHMQAHVAKHTGEKTIACYNCGTTFVTKFKLLDHLKRQMQGDYQCSQCFRLFPTEKYLLIHEKAHVNYFKCTLCDMSCASKSSLAKHIRYRHITERPFQCKECSFKAVTKRDLDIHMNTHNKELSIKCPDVNCPYTCRAFSSLRIHAELEHGQIPKIYKCHICDQEFKYGKRLSKHLISQHKYQYPPGHLRFTYKQDEDGFFKFQTMRLESLEVTKQIMSKQENEHEKEILPNTTNIDLNSIKRIEDFDVMKKYLKPSIEKSTNITIEVTDTDDKGNKIKSETFHVEEIVVAS
uniref:CSON012447 protein n=1 Tax=Culicoides sonorensis TaxID=179676 RepID=A0A336M5I8_CULSO